MPDWKAITTRPAGALPANLATKAGVILLTLLIGALVLSTALTDDDATDVPDDGPPEDAQPVLDAGITRRIENQIEQRSQRELANARAAERAAERQRLQAALAPAIPTPLPPIQDPTTGRTVTPEEQNLRLELELEALERRLRSLRSDPVTLSLRPPPGQAPAPALPDAPAGGDAITPVQTPTDTQPMLDALGGPTIPPPSDDGYIATPGELDIPLPDSRALPAYDAPPRVTRADDPEGWERVHEGSFVEATLRTQLTGDFPSPVLAHVAVPFYSRDRQRVLIPRGSLFLGTAQPVRGQDQDSLAVGFHRVLLPDGGHVVLRFQGLDQTGEGALSDQVNRHYFSTFLAAGAVGLMGGLALLASGSSPYGVGIAQTTGQTGQTVMRRFLNRLPDVTIRAGHRLRIWFTSDVLFPIA